VGLVAESINQALTGDGLAVTLFYGRLDLASGTLRYVDAGCGWCVIRRASGEVARLPLPPQPMGSMAGTAIEGQVRLETGDVLLVSTDGLVQAAGGAARLEERLAALDPASSADEMVAHLVRDVRGRQREDATVMLLRRTDRPSPAGSNGRPA
jgi:serine phosphatase RsbU (regulator of sigma subunit)